MRRVHGEQYAQVDNADPFAPVVWRSPVHRTPEWIIWLVQLVRLLARVVWFVIRHPLLDVAAGVLALLMWRWGYGANRIQDWWAYLNDPTKAPYVAAQAMEIIRRGGGIGTNALNTLAKTRVPLPCGPIASVLPRTSSGRATDTPRRTKNQNGS